LDRGLFGRLEVSLLQSKSPLTPQNVITLWASVEGICRLFDYLFHLRDANSLLGFEGWVDKRANTRGPKYQLIDVCLRSRHRSLWFTRTQDLDFMTQVHHACPGRGGNRTGYGSRPFGFLGLCWQCLINEFESAAGSDSR